MAKQEKIYTIPVNDAFNQVEKCPLCALANWQDDNLIDFYLGPSLMEADHRQVTNAKGFCKNHLHKLYDSQKNRLGLGLMLHTHLQDLSHTILPAIEKLKPSETKGGFFKKGSSWQEDVQALAREIQAREASCTICDRIEDTMKRYREVIFHQYKTDDDFRQRFQESQGFCLKHMAFLIEGSAEHLKKEEADVFLEAMATLHKPLFAELTGDVEWFTLKFDYRNQDAPWKNSKDALPRAIKRLEGEENF